MYDSLKDSLLEGAINFCYKVPTDNKYGEEYKHHFGTANEELVHKFTGGKNEFVLGEVNGEFHFFDLNTFTFGSFKKHQVVSITFESIKTNPASVITEQLGWAYVNITDEQKQAAYDEMFTKYYNVNNGAFRRQMDAIKSHSGRYCRHIGTINIDYELAYTVMDEMLKIWEETERTKKDVLRDIASEYDNIARANKRLAELQRELAEYHSAE